MENQIINIQKIFKSEKKAVRYVEPLIWEIREKIQIDDERFYNILIALTEAVNNAIIHGNKCDANKNVMLTITANSNYLRISVLDQWKGFDPSQVEDPREPENLLKDSGRGVFLISELTDSYEYKINENGTLLTLNFKIA